MGRRRLHNVLRYTIPRIAASGAGESLPLEAGALLRQSWWNRRRAAFLLDGIQRPPRQLSDCEPGISGWTEDKYPWILQMVRMEIATGSHGHVDWLHATET
jgi:hypothetical protein